VIPKVTADKNRAKEICDEHIEEGQTPLLTGILSSKNDILLKVEKK